MLSLTVPKFPSKVAAVPALLAPKPVAGAPAPATVAPIAPGAKVPAVATPSRSLTHPIQGKYNPADVAEVASTPTARKESPVSSAISRVLPNLSGRTGMGLGALAGGVLGAVDPGTDSDGDRKSRLGGALGGALTGAALGGAAGMVGRRAVVNPMMKRLSTNPGVVSDVAASRAANADKLKPGAADPAKLHAAGLFGIGHQDVTPQHLANAAAHAEALKSNPNALVSQEGLHQNPDDLTKSIHAALANPQDNAHVNAAHQIIQKHLSTPEAVDAAYQRAHEGLGLAAPAPAKSLISRGVEGLKALVAKGEGEPVAPAPAGPAAPQVPGAPAGTADTAAKQKWLAHVSSTLAQHGQSDAASKIIGAQMPSHQGLAQIAAQSHAATAPAAGAASGATQAQQRHIEALNAHAQEGHTVGTIHGDRFTPSHFETDKATGQLRGYGTKHGPNGPELADYSLDELNHPLVPKNLEQPKGASRVKKASRLPSIRMM